MRRQVPSERASALRLATFYQVERAAHEGAAHFKETQRAMDLAGDADADSGANERSLANRGSEPKRTAGTQVNSVEPPVDLQCSREASRPSGQISEFVGFAKAFHQLDSFERLNGAEQDACANPRHFSRHVEHVGRPINEVHISKSSFSEQALVSGRWSTIGMTTGIARWVSLGLDDTTAHGVSPGLTHQGFPDEIAGQLGGITRQAGP